MGGAGGAVVREGGEVSEVAVAGLDVVKRPAAALVMKLPETVMWLCLNAQRAMNTLD